MRKQSQNPLWAFSLGNSGSQMYAELLDFISEVSAVRVGVRAFQGRKSRSPVELVSANHQSGVVSYAESTLVCSQDRLCLGDVLKCFFSGCT